MKYPRPILGAWLCLLLFVEARAADYSVVWDAEGLSVGPARLITHPTQGGLMWQTYTYVKNTPLSDNGYHQVAFAVGKAAETWRDEGYSATMNPAGGEFTLEEETTVCVEAAALAACGAYDQSGFIEVWSKGAGSRRHFQLNRDSSGHGTGFRSFLGYAWDDCLPGPGPEERYNHKSLAAYGTDHTGGSSSQITQLYSRQNLTLPAGTYEVRLRSTEPPYGFVVSYLLLYLPKPDVLPPPNRLELLGDVSPATAGLTASPATVVAGDPVVLSLTQAEASDTYPAQVPALASRRLSGAGLRAFAPGDLPRAEETAVPRTVGPVDYIYTVPGGHVRLSWRSSSPTGRFYITHPSGRVVEVTGRLSYNAYQSGAYTITQVNRAGSVLGAQPLVVSLPDAEARVSVVVLPPPKHATLELLPSEQKVSAPGRFWDGRSYKRAWLEGTTWHAYLGRAGVRFVCRGVCHEARRVELQAKSPEVEAVWTDLAAGEVSSQASDYSFSCELTVRLGGVSETDPLIPESCARGRPSMGSWSFRSRVCDSGGEWSDWSPLLAVQVDLPVTVKTETLQTLPPAGEAAEWFVASEPRTFPIALWIP